MRLPFFSVPPAFYIWRNPDGSYGGEVSVLAEVHPTAIIEKYGTVLSGAKVPANAVVKMGEVVSKEGYTFSVGPKLHVRHISELRP